MAAKKTFVNILRQRAVGLKIDGFLPILMDRAHILFEQRITVDKSGGIKGRYNPLSTKLSTLSTTLGTNLSTKKIINKKAVYKKR